MAHLVEEAVQAQVVLMTENRRYVHRDAKAGPDFGSVVYGTVQEALAFVSPADAPPAYVPPADAFPAHAPPAYGPPAYAAASSHVASASGVPCRCLACASVFNTAVMSGCDARA